MKEQDFKKYRKDLKIKERSSSKTLWLVIYVCFIYLVCGAFSLCVSYSLPHQYQYIHLGSIQWFCYSIASPLSLQIIPNVISKLKFRIILVAASIGMMVFLTPIIYAGQDGDPSLIYILLIPVSLIAGMSQTFLLFGLLFYLSNLTMKQEKIVYYGAFFSFYSLQWVLGSFIGDMFITYINVNIYEDYVTRIYVIITIWQFCICILYLTIPESEEECRYKQFKRTLTEFENKTIENQKSIEPQQKLRELLIKSNYEQEEQQSQQQQSQSQSQLHLFKSELTPNRNSNSLLTLQCFSIDQSSLIELEKSGGIYQYKGNSYYKNIFITWQQLYEEGITPFLIFVFFIASIQAFLLSYFFQFFSYPGYHKALFQIKLIQEGYLYVGIGELLGTFGYGMLGDAQHRIHSLYFILGIAQFGCIIGWTSYYYMYEILVLTFSCSIGFCDSALMATIISVFVFKFPKHIYLIDLLYFLYSFSFAIGVIMFMFTPTYIVLGIIQLLGLCCLLVLLKFPII